MSSELLLASLPLIVAWVWWVDRKVAAHEAILVKLDHLINLLLEERLDKRQ